ncbi:MAG TPA: hypothetical protein VHF07_04350 [Nitrospiraceae bacterium]|nr:hypothetical protein [Nitrospiraceae bacterium]
MPSAGGMTGIMLALYHHIDQLARSERELLRKYRSILHEEAVMKRSFEAVDIMVAVGFCATIVGGFLLLVASSGVVGLPVGEAVTSAQSFTEMDLVEPALGEAIVSSTLLDRSIEQEMMAAAADLNRMTMLSYGLDGSPESIVASAKAWADNLEAASVARAEFVRGRAIVNFTQRGIARGLLSADQYVNAYNDRMIQQADMAGYRIMENFASTQQANLGDAIVSAAVGHNRSAEEIQEGIGAAVVRLTHAQAAYEEANGAIQEQTGALFNAAIRAELQSDQFTQLAQAPGSMEPTEATAFTRTWPEISTTHVIGATLGLMGVLIAGFFMASRRAAEERMPYARFEQVEPVYRKTA